MLSSVSSWTVEGYAQWDSVEENFWFCILRLILLNGSMKTWSLDSECEPMQA